jgi:hypothetical protein
MLHQITPNQKTQPVAGFLVIKFVRFLLTRLPSPDFSSGSAQAANAIAKRYIHHAVEFT